MTDLVLTSDEQKILNGLLDPNAKIEMAVPKTIDPKDLWKNLQICGRAISYLEHTAVRLKPVLGRILLLIQHTPEIYTKLGYTGFDAFMVEEVCVKMGVSRAYVYEAKMIADKWPGMSVERFEEIGSKKLALISRFTNESEPGHVKWLKEAEKHTVTELREIAETKKLISKGEDQPSVIVIPTTVEVAREWKTWCAHPEVQQSAESDNPGMILMRMMQEITVDWGYDVKEEMF